MKKSTHKHPVRGVVCMFPLVYSRKCNEFVCSTNNPPAMWPFPLNFIWYGGHRLIRDCENTALWTIVRDGARVKAWRAAVWVEFAFSRLGVMNAQASWLAMSAWTLTCAWVAIDRTTSGRQQLDLSYCRCFVGPIWQSGSRSAANFFFLMKSYITGFGDSSGYDCDWKRSDN